ncbi:MAG TPA: YIP1 family protein [Gammaproteobacteria bacterium]|nr:YIP1 family protein [Gammaproteobacteria bacterium]
MASNSFFAVAVNIMTAPAEAFAAIKERPRIFLPLLLVICTIALSQYLYVQQVDLGWLIEQQIQASGQQISDADRARTVEAVTRLPKAVYGGITAVSTAIVLPVVFAILALYYTIVSFARGDGVKYKEWFSLLVHCALPTLLGVIATIVHLLVADARFMPQNEINPLSFGSLLSIHPEKATAVQTILLSLDPTSLWALALSVLGYQAFAKSSIVKAAAVVLGPLAVIVLVASAIALLR